MTNISKDFRLHLKPYTKQDRLLQRVTFVNGESISIQANDGAYCYPRENKQNCYTEFFEFELGFPSFESDLIREYAEDKDKLTNTVYGYVPYQIIQQLIDQNGGSLDWLLCVADNYFKDKANPTQEELDYFFMCESIDNKYKGRVVSCLRGELNNE